ncbi:hypothetical protein ASF53_16855 [Methylobacterium sp. Leaf123]|uniref:hypothetical protein n=1 Tax=Methylobacterium sp. Leaf123 TaxID=1736264 RepID=UPI0006F9BA5D|nr:hypothetical protein [Methylobacterium sp. Leaf123]KQQ11831.1 hypothetical protein ASF53_16855 [Methylobacterium sp. Leaf123]
MPMPSVEPVILSVLEPYLEELHRTWNAAGRTAPTLPATDGKVNVRAVVRQLIRRDGRLRPSHEQHFFDKPALRSAVNAIAAEQGLAPIGSRAPGAEDDALRTRLGRVAREASGLRQVLVEREGLIDALRRENHALREQMRLLEETGMVLRRGDLR